MTALYEMTGQLVELQNLDIDDQTLQDTLEGMGLMESIEEKAQALIMVTRNMGGDLEVIDSEIARLQDRKRIIKNRQDGLQQYLQTNMERAEISKISCPLFSITLAKGRQMAVIDTEDQISDDLVTVKTEVRPNKKEILARLKAGETIPGCHLERGKPSLRIR